MMQDNESETDEDNTSFWIESMQEAPRLFEASPYIRKEVLVHAKLGVPPQLRHSVWPWLLRESRSQLECSDCPYQYAELVARDHEELKELDSPTEAAPAARGQGRLPRRGSFERATREVAAQSEREARLGAALRDINRDVDRSGVEHAEGRCALRRVLVAAARAAPEVGYCQGLNFIVATLLQVLDEENAFWALLIVVKMLSPGTHASKMLNLHVDQRVLKTLLRTELPELDEHFDALSLAMPFVTTTWQVTLFTCALPRAAVLRIWDLLFSHADAGPAAGRAILGAGLAVFAATAEELLETDDALEAGERIRMFCEDPIVVLRGNAEDSGSENVCGDVSADNDSGNSNTDAGAKSQGRDAKASARPSNTRLIRSVSCERNATQAATAREAKIRTREAEAARLAERAAFREEMEAEEAAVVNATSERAEADTEINGDAHHQREVLPVQSQSSAARTRPTSLMPANLNVDTRGAAAGQRFSRPEFRAAAALASLRRIQRARPTWALQSTSSRPSLAPGSMLGNGAIERVGKRIILSTGTAIDQRRKSDSGPAPRHQVSSGTGLVQRCSMPTRWSASALARPPMASYGGSDSTYNSLPAKQQMMWPDMQRWAATQREEREVALFVQLVVEKMDTIDPFELHQLRAAHRDDVASELRIMARRREILRLQAALEGGTVEGKCEDDAIDGGITCRLTSEREPTTPQSCDNGETGTKRCGDSVRGITFRTAELEQLQRDFYFLIARVDEVEEAARQIEGVELSCCESDLLPAMLASERLSPRRRSEHRRSLCEADAEDTLTVDESRSRANSDSGSFVSIEDGSVVGLLPVGAFRAVFPHHIAAESLADIDDCAAEPSESAHTRRKWATFMHADDCMRAFAEATAGLRRLGTELTRSVEDSNTGALSLLDLVCGLEQLGHSTPERRLRIIFTCFARYDHGLIDGVQLCELLVALQALHAENNASLLPTQDAFTQAQTRLRAMLSQFRTLAQSEEAKEAGANLSNDHETLDLHAVKLSFDSFIQLVYADAELQNWLLPTCSPLLCTPVLGCDGSREAGKKALGECSGTVMTERIELLKQAQQELELADSVVDDVILQHELMRICTGNEPYHWVRASAGAKLLRGVVRSELVDAAENVGRMATVLDSWATDDSGGESDGEDYMMTDDSDRPHDGVDDGKGDAHEGVMEQAQREKNDEQGSGGRCKPDRHVQSAKATPDQDPNSRAKANDNAGGWHRRLSAAWDGAFSSDTGSKALGRDGGDGDVCADGDSDSDCDGEGADDDGAVSATGDATKASSEAMQSKAADSSADELTCDGAAEAGPVSPRRVRPRRCSTVRRLLRHDPHASYVLVEILRAADIRDPSTLRSAFGREMSSIGDAVDSLGKAFGAWLSGDTDKDVSTTNAAESAPEAVHEETSHARDSEEVSLGVQFGQIGKASPYVRARLLPRRLGKAAELRTSTARNAGCTAPSWRRADGNGELLLFELPDGQPAPTAIEIEVWFDSVLVDDLAGKALLRLPLRVDDRGPQTVRGRPAICRPGEPGWVRLQRDGKDSGVVQLTVHYAGYLASLLQAFAASAPAHA